ncbi:MAG: hypothetical protein KGJ84_05090 [Elusimicrobia bacterium]|nr:hypothetical protein [Elusimicrobiota bacterium]
MNPDINGTCVSTAAPAATGAPPYQWMITLAKALMVIVALLAAIALAFKATVYGASIGEIISKIVLGIGITEMALGVAIMAASGDMIQGGIITAVGALTAATAEIPKTFANANADEMAKMAAGVFISNALGAMASEAAGGKSASMQ